MKLLTKKEIFEDIQDAISTAENYMDLGDQFDALEWIFDEIQKLEDHYEIHKLKEQDYDMKFIKEIAKTREITNLKEGL